MKEIVNKDPLPRGKRFYPVADHYDCYFQNCYVDNLKAMLSKEHYELADKIYSKAVGSHEKTVNQLLSIDNFNNYLKYCTMLTDEEYPVFKVHKSALNIFFPDCTYQRQYKKNHHGGSKRFVTEMMSIPLESDFVKIQWCNERIGVIVHDHIFEGAFKSVCAGKMNKELNSMVQDILSEAQMTELLDIEFEVPDDWAYLSADKKKIGLEKYLPKYIKGESSDSENAIILNCAGMLNREYNFSTRESRYILCKNKVNDKIDLPSTLRTALIYLYGGYTLPENYSEWFDG